MEKYRTNAWLPIKVKQINNQQINMKFSVNATNNHTQSETTGSTTLKLLYLTTSSITQTTSVRFRLMSVYRALRERCQLEQIEVCPSAALSTANLTYEEVLISPQPDLLPDVRTESIMSLERGVWSCAELQVFSCYRR